MDKFDYDMIEQLKLRLKENEEFYRLGILVIIVIFIALGFDIYVRANVINVSIKILSIGMIFGSMRSMKKTIKKIENAIEEIKKR